MTEPIKNDAKSKPKSDGGTKKQAKVTVAERVARMGLVNDWDFVLHLPLRYEILLFDIRVAPQALLMLGFLYLFEAFFPICTVFHQQLLILQNKT